MIFDFFMDYFDMFLEVSWMAKISITNFAVMIFDSFMDRFDMNLEVWLDKFLVTNVTFKFFIALAIFSEIHFKY